MAASAFHSQFVTIKTCLCKVEHLRTGFEDNTVEMVPLHDYSFLLSLLTIRLVPKIK